MIQSYNNAPKWRSPIAWLALAGIALPLWVCGCAHRDLSGGREVETTLPKLTALMTGPAASCLTNLAGFESDCVITLDNSAERPRKYMGRIFARGEKLRLETVPKGSKSAGASEFGVIWDVASNRGWVFSDALQGYAALAGTAQFTNLLTTPLTGQPERLEGRAVDRAEMTAWGEAGQKAVLQLIRAPDLGNLSLQVLSQNQPGSFTLTLTKVQQIMPAEELFQPPDGFTKYASESALLDELTARLQTVFGGGHDRERTPGEAGMPDIHHRTDSNGP